MMAIVRRTRQAEEDLLEIWTCVADENADAADALLDEIDAVCATLAQTPLGGRAREELAPGVRSFPVGNYVVFYRPDKTGVTVIRVLHGARDLPRLL